MKKESNLRNIAEKALKSFLKHKKVGFTAALLTAFMITGGISLASALAVPQPSDKVAELSAVASATQEDLLAKIAAQKEEVLALIEENEARLRELEYDKWTLVRKADYYSKPIYPSTQIFFNFGFENGGKMKDRTAEYLGSTINAVEEQIAAAKPEDLLQVASQEEVDAYLRGDLSAHDLAARVTERTNGIALLTKTHIIEIDLGVQITPLQPDVPVVSINTPSVNVSAPATPTITAPSLTVPTPTLPSSVPTAPTVSINVAVSAPSAVAPISITAPVAPSPSVPTGKTLTVPTPPTPGVFEPLVIVPPEEPSMPSLPVIVIPTVTAHAATTGTGDNAWIWNQTGDLGPINQINITAGTFTATSDNGGITGINISGYAGAPTTRNGTLDYTSSGGTFGGWTATASSVVGFYKWCGAPYFYMAAGTTFNWIGEGTTSRALVKNDVHGDNATVLSTLLSGSSTQTITAAEGTYITSNIYPYHNHSNAGNTSGNGSATVTELMYGVNYGTWNLSGSNINGYEADGHGDQANNRATIFHNAGTIHVLPGSTRIGVYAYGHENTGFRTFTSVNSGTVTIDGSSSAIFAPNRSGTNHEVNFLNYGTLIINGGGNAGLFLDGGSDTGSTVYMAQPLEIYGDSNIGMYVNPDESGTITYNLNPNNTDVKINIGVNQNASNTNVAQSSVGTGNDATSGFTSAYIEGNVGILTDHAVSLHQTDIKIGQQTKSNIGVFTRQTDGALNIGGGSIIIYGGLSNIGLYANTADITSTNNLTVSGGESNIAIYSNGKNITAATVTMSGTTKNSFGVVANGGTVTLSGGITATGLTVDNPVDDSDGTVGTGGDNTNNTMAAFATNNAVININKSTKSGTPDISVTGAQVHDESATLLNKYRGLAFMASAGGTINATNYNIEVKNGSVGVASIGTGSAINLTGSDIYVDKGYGLYSDGVGTINFTNGYLELDGDSVGLVLDLAVTPINLTGATIHVISNNVTVANLVNVTTPLNVSTLATDVSTAMSGVSITDDGVHTNYKIAAVDGATINIDEVLTKGNATNNASDEYFFFKRFLAQRSKLNVNDNVNAVMTAAQAALFGNTVSALEMSSSNKAVAVSETTITVASGKKVEAGWSGTGTGATGLFINYGLLTNNGTIEIELANKNKQGVAIYSVNGAKAVNAGTITTDGEEAIGMYGTAYRQGDDGAGTIIALGKEFGAAAVGQGQTELTNNSGQTIEVKGDKSVGMYLWNNSTNDGTPAETVKASNAGTIKATGDDAVGIYGKGNGTVAQTEVGSTGTIEVGKNGMAFYLDNAVTVKNVGNLILGEDAIGLVLDPNSVLDPAATFGTVTTSTAAGDKMVVAVIAPTMNTTAQTLKMGVDASATDAVTLLYVQKRQNVTLDNTAAANKVGKKGVGVYVDDGNATNISTIELVAAGDTAVGMYTANGEVINDVPAGTTGIIKINKGDQLGMIARGATAKATNNGEIDINANGATGIYVENGATVDNNGLIVFNAQKSFGIAANNSTVNLAAASYTLANADENIYVYAENGALVNLLGNVTVNGSVAADPKKSVGVYLDGSTTVFDGNLFNFVAQNGIVGIFANSGNTIKNTELKSQGDKTVGAYFTNAGTLDTVNIEAEAPAAQNAIGVYGNSGVITAATNLAIALGSAANPSGTGFYLTNGSRLTGSGTTLAFLNNNTTSDLNVGIYYTKGTASSQIANDVDITLGSNLVGIYADNGVDLVQTSGKNIVLNVGAEKTVAAFVANGSKFTYGSGSTLSLGATTTDGNVGIYVSAGEGINAGTISVSDPSKGSAAMIARGATAADTAAITNSGTLNISAGVGMLVGGYSAAVPGKSEGVNSGTINVTSGDGVGVVLSGVDNSTFDGTGGTISVTGAGSSAVGLYLNGVGSGKLIATGTIALQDADAVGIFGDGATKLVSSTPIVVTGSNGGVGVFVKDTTEIGSDVDASGSTDTVAVFLSGPTASGVTFSGNKEIKTGTASASGSAIGLLLDGITGGNYVVQNVKVSATGANSIGIAVTGGTYADVKSDVTANNGALGVYVDAGSTYDGTGGTLTIGLNAIGVFLGTGATGLLGVNGPITLNFTDPTAVGVFNDGGTLTLGSNITTTGSGTMAATLNGNLTNSANLTVDEGAVALLGKYTNPLPAYSIVNNAGASITATRGGIALGALDGVATPPGPSVVTLENKGTITVSGVTTATGAPAIGIYTNIAEIVNTTGTLTAGADGIGIYADGSGKSVDFGTISLTGTDAIGVVAGGAIGTTFGGTAITAGVDETKGFFFPSPSAGTVNLGSVTLQKGSVGAAVSGGTIGAVNGTVTVGDSTTKTSVGLYANAGANVTLGTASFTVGQGALAIAAEGAGTVISGLDGSSLNVGADGVGIYINDGATVNMATGTGQGDIVANGNIGVMIDQLGGSINGLNDINVSNGGVGAYFYGNAPTISGTINVGAGIGGGTPQYSVGAYYENVSVPIALPTVNQTGSYSIGAVVQDSTTSVTSPITLSGSSGVDHQIGLAALGTGTPRPIVTVGAISVNTAKSIGVYAENADVNGSGPITVGPDTAVGIVSSQDGNVNYTGSVSVAPQNNSGSIAIYKNGDSGTITTADAGTAWDIGEGGYGLYVDSTTSSTITATNNAAMNLKASAVGAFINGTVSFTNTGALTVGATYIGADHDDVSDDLNSVGIYLADGATGVNASSGTITVGNGVPTGVDYAAGHSVGAYATGANTTFTNNGTITVDNGGIGVFVRDYATAINKGTINVDGKDPDCDQVSVGMAAYDHAKIINDVGANINVTGGAIGMLIGSTASIENRGTITIDSDSTGISGHLSSTDVSGTINGTGTKIDEGDAGKPVGDGAIQILPDGQLVIEGTYYAFGGTLIADQGIIANDVVVDLTNFDPEKQLFKAPDFEGTIRMVSNFPTIGNGYAWKVEDFVQTLTGMATAKVKVVTSPLFLAKLDDSDGSLILAKDAYKTLAVGDQFDNLYDGLDSILRQDESGESASSQVLKGMNSRLEEIYQSYSDPVEAQAAFNKEASRMLAETRGDIYATIQGRMQNVERAFDYSFNELLSSYNFTKDTDKYSVIYQQGTFSDDTVGVDDYDYRVQGLYYMKEKEGRNFGNKWGWSLGFAVSRFDFDDAPTFHDKSKEDIYSVRAGVHFVKNFTDSDSFRWISRLELGYNRHEATRSIELDKLYKNKATYDSYQVSFDNRLEKTVLRTRKSKIDLYAGLNLEYGKFGKFTEKAKGSSGLTLDVAGNDYFSIQPEIGVKGEKRVYIGKKISAKLYGSLGLGYEFGENYEHNRARVHEGTEGWYDLSEPAKEKAFGKATVGVALEKANHYGVSFDVEARKHTNKQDPDVRFSLRFNYKFMNDR